MRFHIKWKKSLFYPTTVYGILTMEWQIRTLVHLTPHNFQLWYLTSSSFFSSEPCWWWCDNTWKNVPSTIPHPYFYYTHSLFLPSRNITTRRGTNCTFSKDCKIEISHGCDCDNFCRYSNGRAGSGVKPKHLANIQPLPRSFKSCAREQCIPEFVWGRRSVKRRSGIDHASVTASERSHQVVLVKHRSI